MEKQFSFYRDRLDSLRVSLGPDDLLRPNRTVRMLVIDDDESFLRIMERAARRKGITLKVCQNADEAARLSDDQFDVLVVDYMLGEESGLDAAAMWEHGPNDKPVILISQTTRIPPTKRWPGAMREFVHKRLGPFAIIEAAIEAVEISELQNSIGYPSSLKP